uniref:Uncharacterized protein n=1 Tax=Rhizophora mucronata TaxID=61149 RepID=A0A2P2R596_RHIMU
MKFQILNEFNNKY